MLGVIIGGCIGIIGSLLTTLLREQLGRRRTKSMVSNAIRAQIEFTKDKAQRFKEGKMTVDELRAGRPLYKSLADNFGFLSQIQAEISSKALLMYYELAEGGRREKADDVIAACTAGAGCTFCPL